MKKHSAADKTSLQDMLSAVFLLCLLDKDVGRPDLDALIKVSMLSAMKKAKTLRHTREAQNDLVLLGSILHRWFKNPKYLDHEARPVPIKARGRAPSVEALFREERRHDAFDREFKHMISVGMVSKDKAGLYVPKNEWALHRTLTPEMVGNLALTIGRMVATLLSNSTLKKRSSVRLIERTALVLDLPRSRLPEFKTFAQEQGGAFVSTMNDWLENRRVSEKERRHARRQSTLSAGVHVLAFLE